jgi:hypothetical protein
MLCRPAGRPVGQLLLSKIPQRHWRTTAILAALGNHGPAAASSYRPQFQRTLGRNHQHAKIA